MLSDKESTQMQFRYLLLPVKRFIITLIFSLSALLLMSQETSTCAENLKSAQTFFDNGQVEQVPGMLEECLRSGFKQEEELSAYKLIIQTFFFQDRNQQADSAMLSFLRKYPEYQLSPTDHSSFVHLYNSFNVRPVVQLAFRIGSNLPFITFIDPETLASELKEWDYSTNAANLYGSVEVKYALTPKLEINIETGYSQLSFTTTENFFDQGLVTYNEVLHRLETPVTVTYNIITFSKFTAYARAGGGPAFNLMTKSTCSYVPTSVIYFPDSESPEIKRNDCRIKMDLFCQAGGGIKLKIPKGFLNFEIRTNLGFYNQVKNRTGSAEDLTGYFYSDDDFNLNTVNLSFGYTKIFYKPSKRN